jgi:hypothetical protein
MGRRLGLLVACAAMAVAVGPAQAGNESAAFDRLKALVGEWQGKNGAVKITYTLVSGGSALMERMQPANEPEMITMYSADGDRILVTHYCSQGNQPQMESGAMKAKSDKYSFAFLRVSGMKSPDEGHMVGLVLTLVDKDHITQEWKYMDKGKTSAEVFEYTRKPEKPATVVPTGS